MIRLDDETAHERAVRHVAKHSASELPRSCRGTSTITCKVTSTSPARTWFSSPHAPTITCHCCSPTPTGRRCAVRTDAIRPQCVARAPVTARPGLSHRSLQRFDLRFPRIRERSTALDGHELVRVRGRRRRRASTEADHPLHGGSRRSVGAVVVPDPPSFGGGGTTNASMFDPAADTVSTTNWTQRARRACRRRRSDVSTTEPGEPTTTNFPAGRAKTTVASEAPDPRSTRVLDRQLAGGPKSQPGRRRGGVLPDAARRQPGAGPRHLRHRHDHAVGHGSRAKRPPTASPSWRSPTARPRRRSSSSSPSTPTFRRMSACG